MLSSCSRYFKSGISKSHYFTQNSYNPLSFSSLRSVVIGIDLRTTNSAVSLCEGTQPKIIQNAEGHRTTPSYVAFTNKKERLVGTSAKRQAVTNPKSTFSAIKRLIGRRFDDPFTKEIQKTVSYDIVDGDNGYCWVYCDIMQKKYSPSQIVAFILQKMKEAAQDYVGTNVDKAVITVPACFNELQRQVIKDAGAIAGLDVLTVINESTAAALAYGLGNDGTSDSKKDGIVAVYDLGGGSFSISILSLSDGVFEFMATDGDTALGGEDFDYLLLEFMVKEFRKEYGIDLMGDKFAIQRLKEEAERVKIELSSKTECDIYVPFLTGGSSGPFHLNTHITRSQFEALVDTLISRTIKTCEQCLKDAGFNQDLITDVDHVVLVGGMTRMPKVQNVVEKFFAKQPSKSVNPDEAVAMGAAIEGGVIDRKVDGIVLIEITSLSLGIETVGDRFLGIGTVGGRFTRLIEKNTAFPTKKGETFSTAADNQTQVRINVYQGERDMAADNQFLGHFDLLGIPPAPRGTPQIEVSFDIDANGILDVSAKVKGTNKDQTMQIQVGLTKEEIENMKKDADEMAAQDKQKREFSELKNSADTLIWQSESNYIEEFKNKIGCLKQEINAQVSKLRDLRSSDDASPDELKAEIEKLNKVMSKIGEKIYQQNPHSSTSTDVDDQTNDSVDNQSTDTEYEKKKQ